MTHVLLKVCVKPCARTQCESAGLGLNQERMLRVAGVGQSTVGGAVAKNQDVGVFLPTFALTSRTLPPHQSFRSPSIPGAGEHQVLLVVGHIGGTHRLCRRDIWSKTAPNI